jgi:hypothetical protein
MPWGKVVVLGLVIAAALTAYAVGAGSQPSNTVVLCAAKKSGAVTLAGNGKCGKGKKKVSIAKEGPAGPAGSPGPKGEPGAAGDPAASINTGIIETSSFGTYFGAPSGVSGPATTESEVWTVTPAGAPINARDLSVSIPFTLAGEDDVSLGLRVNGANTALSCIIHVGSSGCQDTSDVVTIPPGSHISMATTVGGEGAFQGTLWSFGWRAGP